MTKQEYMDKLNAAWFSGARCGKLKAATEIKDEYIASLEAENAALTLLHTQATDQMIKMQNRAHELEAENANLRADNRSFVEQVNKMALKPNQEIIEWHQHPLYPDTSRCCIVECTDNCFYIAHHSDIDGWLHSITYRQLLNVKSWAYLPKGVINEHKTN
jgi:hypothetical protein